MDKQKALLFGSAAAIRLLLYTAFPSLPNVLTNRVELSTPVTSFKRLQEGLFLYSHSVSPYDGGIFHQAPLLLPLFSLLPDISQYPVFANLLYILVDLLSANALEQVANTGLAASSRFYTSPRKDAKASGISVVGGYLFNPFTILTCIARPTSVFTHLFVLVATSCACRGLSATFLFSIAAASYLSLYPVMFFPPLAIICYDVQRSEAEASNRSVPLPSIFALQHTLGLFVTVAALLGTSFWLMGDWKFLASHYGTWLLLPDLTPNVGLWWYFFIEMFDPFRAFFLGVFWLHMISYVPGLCFRLRDQPLFIVVCLLGIVAVFAPYPDVGMAGVFLSGLGLFRHIWPLMRYTFLTTSTLLYASTLGPAFYHLWISAGSGNANFFYAITLVWSLGLSVFVADSLYAILRDEWEVERPEMKGRSDVSRM